MTTTTTTSYDDNSSNGHRRCNDDDDAIIVASWRLSSPGYSRDYIVQKLVVPSQCYCQQSCCCHAFNLVLHLNNRASNQHNKHLDMEIRIRTLKSQFFLLCYRPVSSQFVRPSKSNLTNSTNWLTRKLTNKQ